jgi:hypothetical protein
MEKLHLTRIQVPNFRALKNIDITFEPYLVPRVFPIGSLNGGGKSTLLQLIFTLLYCSSRGEDGVSFVKNMISGFEAGQILAIIDCAIGDQTVIFEFHSSSIPDLSYQTVICEYDISSSQKTSLVCNFKSADMPGMFWDPGYLKEMSQSIFLAAPITQPFRFIDLSIRELAFQETSSDQYQEGIRAAREKLVNFFAYDTVAVGLLLKAFMAARDDDFRSAITNSGKYGDRYSKMLQDMEQVLGDKRVNIDLDFTGISFFKKDNQGDYSIKLYPEDLSHGELKRLSLFVWLKYNKIENSIVLMDEVEIALHPDWQYQIVQDLQNWAPSNQYILATHSYELCQALTPAHVKEISPHLLQK